MAAAAKTCLFAGKRFSARRRRGAQPGNRNRLKHGGFSGATRARHEAVRRVVRYLNYRVAEAKTWHACEQAGPLWRFARKSAVPQKPCVASCRMLFLSLQKNLDGCLD